MGISSQGGRHLDDLLGSFTPTSTVGTECSNNWYLYKRWLQLAVIKPFSDHIIENCLHVKLARTRSFPRETYVTGGIVFIFLRERSQVDKSPSFVIFASHAPAAVSSHCLWLACTIVHCWCLAKCNIGCWASQIPPTPPNRETKAILFWAPPSSAAQFNTMTSWILLDHIESPLYHCQCHVTFSDNVPVVCDDQFSNA